jgi:hypothetical protein
VVGCTKTWLYSVFKEVRPIDSALTGTYDVPCLLARVSGPADQAQQRPAGPVLVLTGHKLVSALCRSLWLKRAQIHLPDSEAGRSQLAPRSVREGLDQVAPAHGMYEHWGWSKVGTVQPTPYAPVMDAMTLPIDKK